MRREPPYEPTPARMAHDASVSREIESRGWLRWLYAGLGFVSLGVGIVGLILPVMPGTVFLILALGLFARSSPRMERWMLEHPRIGPPLRDWQQGTMRPRTKVIAIATIWLAIGGSAVAVELVWWRWTAAILVLGLTWYLATRPVPVEPPRTP